MLISNIKGLGFRLSIVWEIASFSFLASRKELLFHNTFWIRWNFSNYYQKYLCLDILLMCISLITLFTVTYNCFLLLNHFTSTCYQLFCCRMKVSRIHWREPCSCQSQHTEQTRRWSNVSDHSWQPPHQLITISVATVCKRRGDKLAVRTKNAVNALV